MACHEFVSKVPNSYESIACLTSAVPAVHSSCDFAVAEALLELSLAVSSCAGDCDMPQRF